MKKIFLIIFLIFAIFIFFKTQNLNYEKQKEIKKILVEHPEFLPTKQSALNSSFGFKNIKADYYWLEAIQYIWGNAITSAYKKYLFPMIDLITELNPYFSEPYIFWELLLPSYNIRYEDLPKQRQEELKMQAEKIWLKWVKNFCDLEKINLIEKEDNLEKLFTEKKYKNPCKNSDVVYNLAFIYYFYLKDFKNAVKYYKVTSVTDWSPLWAKNLISILEGRWWNREKSFFMFLNMANYSARNNQICSWFSSELYNLWKNIFDEKIDLNWDLLKNIEKIRKENIPNEELWFSATNCWNYLNKAIRELNVFYLDEANQKYKEETWKIALFPQELFEKKYINYIPIDYQQEKNYWIIYFYNDEIWWFDYKMWNY